MSFFESLAAKNKEGEVMNFKERMSKQNNSIKVLLRKLKRHDTIVVAIAVVIALALSGGLIYLTTPAVTASATAASSVYLRMERPLTSFHCDQCLPERACCIA